jgi:thiamine-phosphate pyrophosphorylase
MVAVDRRERLQRSRLYLVVGARPDVVRAALLGGVDVVQLREKDVPRGELLRAAEELRGLCSAAGALFLVNDDPELARDAAADGVHVGQDDAPVAEARVVVGPDALVGLSTHSVEQIEAADGADYVGVGPVWETPTKAGRPGVGLELVGEASRRARVPWFAIGGIDLDNADEVVVAGATRIAVVRAIGDAADPEAAARALRARLR